MLLPIFSYSQFIVGEQSPIDLDIQNPRIARSGDIDGDGDIDVVSSSFNGLTWYENQTVLNVEEFRLASVRLYPNPTKGILQVDVPQNFEIDSIIIYDTLGREVMAISNFLSSIDIHNL